MKRSRHGVRLTVFAAMLLAAGWAAPAAPASSLNFGPADPVAVDQPRVAVELLSDGVSLGPYIANYWLLDTGAQSILAAGYAVDEMVEAGYQTEGVFFEQGVGGLSLYDVSAVYDFDFAGSDGVRYSLYDVRILSNAETNFGGFGGVLGTPAMAGRVTTLDMANMLGDGTGFGFDYMGVDFHDVVPAGDAANRYTARVQLIDFPPPLADPNDPVVPTYGPLPFVGVRFRHGGRASGGDFVLDTGGQVSMISTAIAFELGLDANGDGSILDDAVGTTEFQGASGTVEVPLLAIEKIVLPTEQGVDLIWTDLELPVYDIDPAIGGIFGCDMLTTGWFRGVFETGDHGVFEAVHLDFSDPASGEGSLVLDLNPSYEFLTTTISIAGDANEDGAVDILDFIVLKNNFALTPASWGDADFNADGRVDIADFIILKNNFGSTAAP